MLQIRPSFSPETGAPSVATRLAFQPSEELRSSLSEFLSVPTRDTLIRKKGSLILLSEQMRKLDLGDGEDIEGIDTAMNDQYETKVAAAFNDGFMLNTGTKKIEHDDGSIDLGFTINFGNIKQDRKAVRAERQKLIGQPLFPKVYEQPLRIFTRIQPSMRVDDTDVENAYKRLQTKMNVTAYDGQASANMHVTGARVVHQWSKSMPK